MVSFVSSTREQFLALGSSSEAVLYGWRGVFTPLQTLTANGVTAFASFTSATGEDIVIVANGGRDGQREIASHVYRLTANEQLSMVRAEIARELALLPDHNAGSDTADCWGH